MFQWMGDNALRPPPAVEPNFVDPEDRMGENIALHATLLAVMTCCMFMRIYTSHFVIQKLGWDDCEFDSVVEPFSNSSDASKSSCASHTSVEPNTVAYPQ